MVWVNSPSSATATVPPMISGRISRRPSIGACMNDRNPAASSTRPCITWTNPASSLPPSSIVNASS